ncbi:hypothetical protein HKK74_30000 [Actinomadura alba]|uniref:Uncharacterized protein n=2 Tax=Actinomadura alba TaxID=406431 RepID=A0ABR7LYW8_9ACTN|nr:hypothetical protein [Actinomadura alba]
MLPLEMTTEQIAHAEADWAVEAERRPADVTVIATALAESPGPFGEGVDAFMATLGFRFDE